MAWTEQCKMAFQVAASDKINKGGNVKAVLRELATESGISFNTLKGWLYKEFTSAERGYEPKLIPQFNNPVIRPDTENENENDLEPPTDWPTCNICMERKTRRDKQCGRWVYKDTCDTCRKTIGANYIIECPHCNKTISVSEVLGNGKSKG